ncbi:MAG: tRNA epoxyqueuosine(34) reductase QueG [Gemmatimonadota bacterium]
MSAASWNPRAPRPTRSVEEGGETKQRIRRAALEIGFEQVGFAPAEAPAHADAYLEWLDRGWHGGMAYMAREDAVRRRLSPRQALPGCRSLIVASLSYARPEGPEGDGARPEGREPIPQRSGTGPEANGPGRDPLRPVIARYARGPDYHGVFEERLALLAARIEAIAPEARLLPYVDYGPVLERDHAQRAGLGWIGKNTMLIHPELGSYLLLGELLTTLELPPDEPFLPDRCGTCVRCIEACPTDAIRHPRGLDARRCISYLTIELRGAIPEPLRPRIGQRVFGCDICQEVCPWNDEVRPPADSPLHAGVTPGAPVPPETMVAWAEELLALDSDEFRARYRKTVFYRPGRDGLLRNLCVGLGNSGRAEAGPTLRRAAANGSELVREHARWALERLARP